MARSEASILRDLRDIDGQRHQLSLELDEARARKIIKCVHCNRGTQIGALTYIQTHWYVAPYSCTGGDYWNAGEGQYECPKCGETNRLFDRDLGLGSRFKDRSDVIALKRYFKEIVKTYGRD